MQCPQSGCFAIQIEVRPVHSISKSPRLTFVSLAMTKYHYDHQQRDIHKTARPRKHWQSQNPLKNLQKNTLWLYLEWVYSIKQNIMLKRLFQISILLLFISAGAISSANDSIANPKFDIFTTDQKKIINDIWKENALREWAYSAIHADNQKIKNLIDSNDQIKTQKDAEKKTFKLVWRLINYALGLISLISLIILIVAGVQMATAAGDDKKFWAGKASLLKIAKAIWGIAISWLIISMIFWIIDVITKNI